MRSKAKTVAEYVAKLPAERREAMENVRSVILKNLPEGMEEAMNWGMITYQVPLSVCPNTYNHQPLMYAALASQKNHMAVYLSSVYMDPSAQAAFEQAYRATGKRYDAGKSCVRFRRLDDLPLELIGRAIESMTMQEFVERVQGIREKQG